MQKNDSFFPGEVLYSVLEYVGKGKVIVTISVLLIPLSDIGPKCLQLVCG